MSCKKYEWQKMPACMIIFFITMRLSLVNSLSTSPSEQPAQLEALGALFHPPIVHIGVYAWFCRNGPICGQTKHFATGNAWDSPPAA